MFHCLDVNHDGVLRGDEIEAAMAANHDLCVAVHGACGFPAPERHAQITFSRVFEHMDLNHDDGIDFDEFKEFVLRRTKIRARAKRRLSKESKGSSKAHVKPAVPVGRGRVLVLGDDDDEAVEGEMPVGSDDAMGSLFAAVDRNGDGDVTRSELMRALNTQEQLRAMLMATLGLPSKVGSKQAKEAFEMVFDCIDADQTQTMTLGEMRDFIGDMQHMCSMQRDSSLPEDVILLLKAADRNNDGSLSPIEIIRALHAHPELRSALVSRKEQVRYLQAEADHMARLEAALAIDAAARKKSAPPKNKPVLTEEERAAGMVTPLRLATPVSRVPFDLPAAPERGTSPRALTAAERLEIRAKERAEREGGASPTDTGSVISAGTDYNTATDTNNTMGTDYFSRGSPTHAGGDDMSSVGGLSTVDIFTVVHSEETGSTAPAHHRGAGFSVHSGSIASGGSLPHAPHKPRSAPLGARGPSKGSSKGGPSKGKSNKNRIAMSSTVGPGTLPGIDKQAGRRQAPRGGRRGEKHGKGASAGEDEGSAMFPAIETPQQRAARVEAQRLAVERQRSKDAALALSGYRSNRKDTVDAAIAAAMTSTPGAIPTFMGLGAAASFEEEAETYAAMVLALREATQQNTGSGSLSVCSYEGAEPPAHFTDGNSSSIAHESLGTGLGQLSMGLASVVSGGRSVAQHLGPQLSEASAASLVPHDAVEVVKVDAWASGSQEQRQALREKRSNRFGDGGPERHRPLPMREALAFEAAAKARGFVAGRSSSMRWGLTQGVLEKQRGTKSQMRVRELAAGVATGSSSVEPSGEPSGGSSAAVSKFGDGSAVFSTSAPARSPLELAYAPPY